MNGKKKMIGAAIMATMFSLSASFTQTAEAGIFDGIGKGIGDVFGKGKGGGGGGSIEDAVKDTAKNAMKQAAKEALVKALNMDIDKQRIAQALTRKLHAARDAGKLPFTLKEDAETYEYAGVLTMSANLPSL